MWDDLCSQKLLGFGNRVGIQMLEPRRGLSSPLYRSDASE